MGKHEHAGSDGIIDTDARIAASAEAPMHSVIGYSEATGTPYIIELKVKAGDFDYAEGGARTAQLLGRLARRGGPNYQYLGVFDAANRPEV